MARKGKLQLSSNGDMHYCRNAGRDWSICPTAQEGVGFVLKYQPQPKRSPRDSVHESVLYLTALKETISPSTQHKAPAIKQL